MALPRVPLETAVVDPRAFLVQTPWAKWLRDLADAIDRTAQRAARAVALVAQAASIASTAATPALATGLYRVTVYARITQPATTSSSLTVSIGYTDGGVACSQAGAALTGNTTNTVQSLSFVVRVDQGTTISYSTTRASVGATPMHYSLAITVEALPA